jgi:sigma-B regulation protein RsbU (phosphoserine phosphatase)
MIEYSMNHQTGPDDRVRSLSDEVQQLRRAVDELSILNDLARTIGGSGNSEQIIHTLVRRSVNALGAEQGLVTLVPDEEQSTMKTYVRTGGSSGTGHRFLFTDALLGWMQLNMRPLLVDDPQSDERFKGIVWDEKVRSLLAVPMMVRGRLIAVLTVFNRKNDARFTEDDQRLLAIIASQSAQVVENARLQEQEQELLRMRHELQLASVIQQNLLPKSPPDIAGYDIAGSTTEAQMVGGDFFDFVRRPDGCWAFSLGDVSGKGLPASLLMSNVQAILRTHSIRNASPDECLSVASRLLFDTTATDKFVTLFYGVLDPERDLLEYANGGHNKPLLVPCDGEIGHLEHRQLMLGLTGEFPFTSDRVVLREGEMLVIFSDGITEAVNEAQEEFGDERVGRIAFEHRSQPAAEIIQQIVEQVREHCGTLPQQDDMTLVVIKRN